ncbi:hypothetical protein [Paraburkholderia diazotrophica]|uniref:hypothetical protein n=1 Tax=Paraburkholderia diazotrophica TaxID=667676 RepID=UPI00317DC1B0
MAFDQKVASVGRLHILKRFSPLPIFSATEAVPHDNATTLLTVRQGPRQHAYNISSCPRPLRRTYSGCSKASRDTGPSLSTICKHRCRRVAPPGPECRHARTSSSASQQAPDSALGTTSAPMSCCSARDRPQAEDAFRK